jgi:hypothetical protein
VTMKFLIPALAAAFALSPVVVPTMLGMAPAHAQEVGRHPMCSVLADERFQESWATAYGCWGTPSRILEIAPAEGAFAAVPRPGRTSRAVRRAPEGR